MTNPLANLRRLPALLPALLTGALLNPAGTAQQPFRSYPDLAIALPGFLTFGGALADFDGDGNLDAAFVGIGPGALLLVLRGDGTGRFEASPTSPPRPTAGAVDIVAADLNGDGHPDLLLSGGGEVLLNQGDGSFARLPGALPSGATSPGNPVALADLDGDGDRDLIVPYQTTSNGLFLNDGTGRFTDVSSRLPPDRQVTDTVAAGDVDGDGDVDLMFSGRRSNRPGLSRRGEVKLFLNDGQGLFTDASAQRVPQLDLESRTSLLADLDSDQDLDLLVVDSFDGLVLLLGDGAGNFARSTDRLPADTGRAGLALAALDANQDGRLDLLYTDVLGQRLLLADRDGRFHDIGGGLLPTLAGGQHALVGDLDRDGDPDLLFPGTNLLTGVGNVTWFNQHRHVDATTSPTRGDDWLLEIGHRPAATPSLGVGIPLLAATRAQLDLSPFGVLGLDPATLIDLPPLRLTGGAGHSTLRIPVPDLPGLAGGEINVQVLILEPLAEARLTNTWATRIR